MGKKKQDFEITVKVDLTGYTVRAKNKKEARKKAGKMLAKHFARISLAAK